MHCSDGYALQSEEDTDIEKHYYIKQEEVIKIKAILKSKCNGRSFKTTITGMLHNFSFKL